MVGGPTLVAWGLASLRKRRLLENTPTSTVRGAAMGWTELKGEARAATETRAPFGGDCAWWRCHVYERVGNKEELVFDKDSPAPFLLADGTGTVLVDPLGADVLLKKNVYSTVDQARSMGPVLRGLGIDPEGKTFRAEETLIYAGQNLYLLGELAPSRGGARYAEDREQRFKQRLREAKRDPVLMAGADANKDGAIDGDEWELFQRELRKAFDRAEAEPPAGEPLRGVMRSAEDHALHIAPSEENVTQSRAWAVTSIVAGVALGTMGVAMALEMGFSPGLTAFVSGLGALAALGFGLSGKT
jgi:hypothetical protein